MVSQYIFVQIPDFPDTYRGIDVLFPLVGWLVKGFVYPFNNR